jgi:hypothetical protein
MSNNEEFCIDLAFDLTSAVSGDGFYYPMEWGMAYTSDGDDWTQITIEDSVPGNNYTFGTATISIDSGDTITFNVFCANEEGSDSSDQIQSIDWIRICFRPAHDVVPTNRNLQTTPLSGDRTSDFLEGVDTSSATLTANLKSEGLDETFACGIADFQTLLRGVTGAVNLHHVPSGTDSYDYEFTAFLQATDGTGKQKWFRNDPELITGKRGG